MIQAKFKQTEIGKIPENWKVIKLNDICSDISYGYTSSAKNQPIGPKFLRITDIQSDSINWDSVPYCKITNSDHKKYRLNVGDICIARTGASTGTTTILRKEIDAVFASYLIRFKVNRQIADPFFVGYILKSPLWKIFIDSIIGGSAQPGANAKILASFQVPLPPLPKQHAIAKILSDLDEKIELNRQMNKTLESTVQAIFRQWFINSMEEYNEDWIIGKVGDFVALSCEIANPNEFKNELFDHYSIPAFDRGRMPKTEFGSQIKSNKYIIPGNSILLSKLNPRIPRTWLPDIDGTRSSVCSTEFLVIIPTSNVSREFIYCLFNSQSFRNKFSALVTGTSGSHQRVKPEYLLEMDAVIPPADAIGSFTNYVKPLFHRTMENTNETYNLTRIRDSLLPRLMSGRIRVVDSERKPLEE
ncbi:restriction endonuclease subunit S [candidate division WOR-3 bacterium]|nr:restriction endonuclease subunit S [candidate division WOR-3 bacterium]